MQDADDLNSESDVHRALFRNCFTEREAPSPKSVIDANSSKCCSQVSGLLHDKRQILSGSELPAVDSPRR